MLLRCTAIFTLMTSLMACTNPGVLSGIPESLTVTAWNGTMQDSNTTQEGYIQIDLGNVASGTTLTAWFKLTNASERSVAVHALNYDMDTQTGGRWELFDWLPSGDWNRRAPLNLPLTLAPQQSLIVGVPFSPTQLGAARTMLHIDAGEQIEEMVQVVAHAVPGGEPDIEMSHGDLPGTVIELSCISGVCSPLDNAAILLGHIETNSAASFSLNIHNRATCQVLEGDSNCDTCELRIENEDGSHGLSLQNGAQTHNGFFLEHTLSGPIGQKDATCDANGVQTFQINFNAAETGSFETRLLVVSNDPDETRLDIPLQVRVTQPIAVGAEPDIQVTAGSISGPIVASECAQGVCVLNQGVPIALSEVVPGVESTLLVAIQNQTICPAEFSCDQCALELNNIYLTQTNQNVNWQASAAVGSNALHPEREDCELPFSRSVEVSVTAGENGTFSASLHVDSTDIDESQIEIPMQVVAREENIAPAGDPDIEIEFAGITGPLVGSDCAEGVCRIGSVDSPIYLGHLLPGTNQTNLLYVRNRAICSQACDDCALTLSSGIRFANGSSSDNGFSVDAEATASISINPPNAGCSETGAWSTPVHFSPNVSGNYSARLVIESNDPDESHIEIHVAASSGEEPVAIAGVSPCTQAVGYQANCNVDDVIDPMESVRLNGSTSFDPTGLDLQRYVWTVDLAPTGSQRTVGEVLDSCNTAWESGCGTYDGMLVDLPGQYRVCLMVENSAGMQSLVTQASCTTFTVVPHSQLHVQLTWSQVDNADQDLHLVHVENDPRVCNQQSDCHWRNCKPNSVYAAPAWFSDDSAGQGANPRLDVDSTSGSVHENINIDAPRGGTYGVYVHYYEWDDRVEGPSEVTVTIWLGGLEVFSASKTLSTSDAIWRVGNINWYQTGNLSGAGIFQPYDPYNIGAIGQVAFEPGLSSGSGGTYHCSSIQGGWAFPE